MDTIKIGPAAKGRIPVRLPYSPENIAKIKTIPGRRWHKEEKLWSVPDEEGMEERLRELFKDERIAAS